jgi:protein-disulfide isomerase
MDRYIKPEEVFEMIKHLATVGLLACAWSFAAYAAESGSNAGNTVLDIDGTKITLEDIESKHPAILFQARTTFYDAQRKAVDEFINEYLLERQAKKENVTVAELLKRHVNSTLAKDPADESLRVYYEGLDTTESFDAVRDKIVDVIRQRRLAKARTAYLESLRAQAKIATALRPPRAEIALKNTPVRGRADAPVMVVEYSDYECPYCQQIQPALDKLAAEYDGKVSFALKDFPLPMHANALKAAEAAHCAGSQGKYWEYHDLLFTTKQADLPSLKNHARALKLDGPAFDKCLDSGQQGDLVKAQGMEAQGLGLPGTPGFFVNGRFLTGNVSVEMLRQVVEEELRAANGK